MTELAGDTLAEFETESRRLIRRRLVVAAVLGMALVPVFGLGDFFLYPDHVAALLMLRLGCLVITGAVFLLLQSPLGGRHPSWLGITLGVELGVGLAAIPVFIVGYETVHYVSLVLLILSGAVLLPLPPWRAALLSLALAAMYGAAALLRGPVSNVPLLMTQMSAILASGVIALVSMSVTETMRRKEFFMRAALQRASEEKTDLIDSMQEKTRTLAALNKDMEDVLYVASHDLRAPLINVQGFAREVQMGLKDLGAQEPGSPEAKAAFDDVEESLQFILTAIGRMDALIGALLNVSRIGTRTSPTERVALQPMVEKIVESFHYQLEEKKIEVAVGALPVVIGDAVRLNQVFANLVDNAVKYMGESERRQIEVGVRAAGDGQAFFVRDSGPGISPEHQENVFRLFRRLSNGAPGEGLGLAMVRKIIEKHGGRIWIESAVGQGTTFYFTLGTDNAGEIREAA